MDRNLCHTFSFNVRDMLSVALPYLRDNAIIWFQFQFRFQNPDILILIIFT